jgi:hypothetical protein
MLVRFKTAGTITWVSEFGEIYPKQVNFGQVLDINVQETGDGILLTDSEGFHALVAASHLEQVD